MPACAPPSSAVAPHAQALVFSFECAPRAILAPSCCVFLFIFAATLDLPAFHRRRQLPRKLRGACPAFCSRCLVPSCHHQASPPCRSPPNLGPLKQVICGGKTTASTTAATVERSCRPPSSSAPSPLSALVAVCAADEREVASQARASAKQGTRLVYYFATAAAFCEHAAAAAIVPPPPPATVIVGGNGVATEKLQALHPLLVRQSSNMSCC